MGLAPCSLSWRYQLQETSVKSPCQDLVPPRSSPRKELRPPGSKASGNGGRDLIWICPTEQRQTWIASWSFMKVIRSHYSVPTWLHGWNKGITHKIIILSYFKNILHTGMNKFQKTMKTTLALIPFPCKIAANLSNSWHLLSPCRHFVTSGGRGPLKRSWFLSAVKSRDVDWRISFSNWAGSWLQLPTGTILNVKTSE